MAGTTLSGPQWQAAFGPNGSFVWIVQTSPQDTYNGTNVYTVTGTGPTEVLAFNGNLNDKSGKSVTIGGGGTCQQLNLK